MTTQPTEPLEPTGSEPADLTPPEPPMPPEPPAPRATSASSAATASASAAPGFEAPGFEAPAFAAAEDVAPLAGSQPKPGPRTGPIVWGALILVFCGYIAQQAFGGDGLDTAGWIAATVIGLGVLLLGVGIAVLIRNAKRPS